MAVFRGMDRIRNAAAKAGSILRHVRSSCLKGITIVENKVQILKSIHGFLRQYRNPVIATVIAAMGVAAVGIGGQQYVNAHTTDYYVVYWKGQPIGKVSSSDKVEAWLAAKAEQLKQANTPVRYELDDNQVTYMAESAYKAATEDEAVLAALDQKVTMHPVGVELKVNGEVVGVVRDEKEAEELLAKIKAQYVPSEAKIMQTAADSDAPKIQTLAFAANTGAAPAQAAATPERLVQSVDFVENIEIAEVRLDDEKLSDPDKLYEKLTTGSPTPVKYTVQPGDCIVCIAQKLDISPELIYKNNPWIEDDFLQIGDELDLTEMVPMVNVRTVEQVTQIEPIEAKVEYKTSEDMRVGQTKVLRQGSDGQKQVTYRLVKRNGALIEEEVVSEKVLKEAVSKIVLRGTKIIPGEGTGKFIWPVSGAKITSKMGKRWGRMHEGIDIIGNSTIKAADNGIVEFAGYKSGGLGNAVIINHQNGFKTVYGHMKKVTVKKGQKVAKGDQIGIMGSTGRSTGVHLHFEVHLNGKLKNPTSYL